MKARRAVRHALELQRDGAGFSFVEILSPCPTIWKMAPDEARTWIADEMQPVFPLGVLRDRKLPEVADAVPQTNVPALLGLAAKTDPARGPGVSANSTQSDLRLKIAGFGGQGVLLLGQILAEMGMREGREVSWLPSYGPEMRSGSAHCHVCLSRERVGSPLVEHPDVLIAMNELSLQKFAQQMLPGSTVLYNGEAIPAGFKTGQARVQCIPAAKIADGFGNAKVTNMVMLGALLELTRAFPKEKALALLQEKVPDTKLLELDQLAIDAGINWMREEII
jgi:2-oxoisovalerate ferredoxin oxidoreductase beta subunit